MITDYNLTVLNALDTCSGTFTRIKNKNPDEKSVIDYAVTSNDLVPFLKSMTIDESKEITPWRKLKHGKCFTDHNAFLMKLEFPQYAQLKKVGSRETTWNFNDPLGWEKFHKLTSRDMSFVWCWDDSYSADVSYDIWSKKLTSVLRRCFKKKCIKKDKPLYTKEIRSLLDKRQGIKNHIRKCGSSQCSVKSKLRKLDTLTDKK